MSTVETCLAKLTDCTEHNAITIEAVLDVATYICHNQRQGKGINSLSKKYICRKKDQIGSDLLIIICDSLQFAEVIYL